MAEWALVDEPVPLERLVKNLGQHLKDNPKDAHAYYTLGRIYSLAFATSGEEVRVVVKGWGTKKPLPLPEFAPYSTILVSRGADGPDAAALDHLVQSVRNYQQATKLAADKGLYWLGLGWMLERGAAYAAQADAPFLTKPGKASKSAWLDQALTAYRRAYELTWAGDLKMQYLGPGADPSISLEAGQGMLRILAQRQLTAAEKAEASRVRTAVGKLQERPRAITPIIFPMDGRTRLEGLISPDVVVQFDLAGDGREESWPWVGPQAGILVWDPENTGWVTSGRQMFGSVTWWMFWRNGYEALAALDDDRDGWLTGAELAGIAVWCDRNGNAVSEAGEVCPLADTGVVGVVVAATDERNGVLWNPEGLLRADGTPVPTYDWVATSLR
jgi:hypothetical protein